MHSGSGGKKIGQRGRKCIFSSGSLPTLQLCSERNRRLHEEMCADITVQYIIAIPCRPLKTTLDCLSLINVVPARKKSKSIRACKKNKTKKTCFYRSLVMKVCLYNTQTCTECRCNTMPSACNYLTLPLIAPCRACCRPQTSHLSSPTIWGSVSHTNLFLLYLLFGVKERGNTLRRKGHGGGGGGDKNTNPVSLFLTMDACVLCFSRHWMSLLVHVLRILK